MKRDCGHNIGSLLAQLEIVVCILVLSVGALYGDDSKCISCHEGKGYTARRAATKDAARSTGAELRESVHRAVGCVECHSGSSSFPHKPDAKPVDCSRCHSDVGHQFSKSAHGKALSKGDKDVPTCISCHGAGHQVFGVSDPRSPMFRTRLITKCVRCHTDERIQKTHNLPTPETIKAYEKSVHGRLTKEGRPVQAAVCTDCHGAHLILGPRESDSKTSRLNIPATCGRCHAQIYNEYKVSIHGRALAGGKLESPGCTDCHGEHTLALVSDPKAPVYQVNVAKTCAGCHENQALIRKYGLPTGRYSSYVGSFHGVALKYGDLSAASCTSCHEVHRILPSSEAESSISIQNLPKTCGKCHPGMREVSTIGKIHVEATKQSSFGMYLVRRFYLWFIGILMFLFLCYIALDLYGRAARRKRDG
jgi:hypothetical protein